MEVQEHTRALGSRLTDLQVALVDDDGDAVDLTSKTVKFYMYDEEGTVIVSDGTCTITSTTGGLVSYSWAADDVDTAGEYWGYFRVYVTGSPTVYDVYPPGRTLQIIITEGT